MFNKNNFKICDKDAQSQRTVTTSNIDCNNIEWRLEQYVSRFVPARKH